MTYQEVLDYLFSALPMYQKIGKAAYNKTLDNIIALDQALSHPSQKFCSVHVAGTNGKGSSSHLLAAVLQAAGYRTGLYTSPHLKSFTERIKINGREVSEEFVQNFVLTHKAILDHIKPSFFEMTVGMAYSYFVNQVDVAIIEVGLGGRLDSTNIIKPLVSLITQISYDHQDILGETLPQIASEKAGIIKPQTPVVISERQDTLSEVFEEKAKREQAPIRFASDNFEAQFLDSSLKILIKKQGKDYLILEDCPLRGSYQLKNFAGVLATLEALQEQGYQISPEHIQEGFKNVLSLTGFKGRWQRLGENPLVIADVAHNEGGLKEVVRQIRALKAKKNWLVMGTVRDKDLHKILALLPPEAEYIFCQANIPRALPAEELQKEALKYGLKGCVIESPNAALAFAKQKAGENDFIFVGGSTFVVAELHDL